MYKLQGRLLQMQKLAALLLGRGYSDSQMLSFIGQTGSPTPQWLLQGFLQGVEVWGQATLLLCTEVSLINLMLLLLFCSQPKQPDSPISTPVYSTIPFPQATLLLPEADKHTLASALTGSSVHIFLLQIAMFPPPLPSGFNSKVPFSMRLTLTTLVIITTFHAPFPCP